MLIHLILLIASIHLEANGHEKLDQDSRLAENNLLSKSKSLYAERRFLECSAMLSQVINWDPNNATALLERGKCRLKAGLNPWAMDDIDRSLALDPRNKEAWIIRGDNHYASYQERIKNYNMALKLDPKDAYLTIKIGQQFVYLRQPRQALFHFDQAIDIDPANAQAWFERAKIYADLGELEIAISNMDEAIRLERFSASFFIIRAHFHMTHENYSQAIDDYESGFLLSEGQPLPNLLVKRGWCHFKINQYQKAADDFSEAIEFEPQNNRYWQLRALTYLQLNRPKRAIADINEALSLLFYTDNSLLLRALSYLKRGMKGEAFDHMSSVLTESMAAR